MALVEIKTEPGELKNLRQICRLCLSEESLGDVFEEQDLHQWILDFLSITISTQDQMSQSICDICRIRLNEFNEFREHCQEVQVVLQSMMQDQDLEMENDGFDLNSSDETTKHEGKNPVKCYNKDVECEKSNGVDMIEIGEVKIESENNLVSSSSLPEQLSSTLRKVNVQDSEQTLAGNVQGDEEKEKDLPFECNLCLKVLQTRRALCIHDRNVHLHQTPEEIKRDTVQNISENKTVSDLKHQATIHSNDGEYSCSKCNQVFNRQCLLKNHMKTHDAKSEEDQPNDMEEECRTGETDSDYSEAASATEKLVQAEKGIDMDQMLKCDQCPKSFSTQKKLRDHRRCHAEKNLACHICEKAFKYRRDLHHHIATHDSKNERNKEGQFKCDVCENKSFSTERQLHVHKKAVHGAKTFECHICGKSFLYRRGLQTHIATHDTKIERKERCLICGVKVRKQNLVRHEQRHHEDSKAQQKETSTIINESVDDVETRKTVDKDVKQTSTSSLPKEPKLTASAFQCNICGKVCLNQNNLLQHKKFVHEKKLRCTLCNAPFVLKKHLETHMRTKHEQKDGTYKFMQCEICNVTFETWPGLLHHKRTEDCKKKSNIKETSTEASEKSRK